MTQKERILKLVKEAGIKGIGSNELRSFTHAVDVPKVISDLRKAGHPIDSRDISDGTVIYTYRHSQPQWVVMGYDQSGKPLYGWIQKKAKLQQEQRVSEPIYGTDNVTGERVLLNP